MKCKKCESDNAYKNGYTKVLTGLQPRMYCPDCQKTSNDGEVVEPNEAQARTPPQ